MNIRPAVAAASMLAAASAFGAAGPEYFSVGWNCPHTRSERIRIPDTTRLRLGVDPYTGQVDSSELRTFIAGLERDYPAIDFHTCMEDLQGTIETYVGDKCGVFDGAEYDACLVEPNDAFSDLISAYSAGAYERNALPVYAPLGESDPPLSDRMSRYYRQQLGEDCGSYANPRYLDHTFTYALDEITEGLADDCKAGIGRMYSRLLLDSQLDQVQCRRSHAAGSSACRTRRLVSAVVARRLSVAGIPPFSTAIDPARPDCPVDMGILNVAMSAAASAEDAVQCVQPKLRESLPVRKNGTGLPTYYSLKKTGANSFDAIMDLTFVDADGNEDSGLNRRMRRHTQRCLDEANPNLRGPNEATLRLKLNPASGSSRDPNVPPKTIWVDPDSTRANASVWEAEERMGCATVIHELLHLLGLVDEYHESSMGTHVDEEGRLEYVENDATTPMANCRALGPRHSIMSSHHEAFERMRERKQVSGCSCSSEFSDDYDGCLVSLRALTLATTPDNSSCPANTGTRMGSPTYPGDPGYNAVRPGRISRDPEGDMVFVTAVEPIPAATSLLMPAHFRAITQPGCMAVNSTYFRCSREAYRTSRGAYARATCSLDRPAACSRTGPEGGLERSEEWLQ